MINVDKNASYPPAIDELKTDEQLPKTTELRLVLYLNNRVEQEHRLPQCDSQNREWDAGSFNTARRTLRGIEAMNMERIRTSFLGLKKAMREHK